MISHFVLTPASFCFPGSSSQRQYTGEIGGTVTFQCPWKDDQNRSIQLLYFQKGDKFVNGFYATKPVENTWENTIFDRQSSTLQILNLNTSHIGNYQCHIMYSEDGSEIRHEIYLNVTGMHVQHINLIFFLCITHTHTHTHTHYTQRTLCSADFCTMCSRQCGLFWCFSRLLFSSGTSEQHPKHIIH